MSTRSSVATSAHVIREDRHHESSRDVSLDEKESSLSVASRLISEAAHDIRAPLTGIREAIRLVHDGELGEVNELQREMLSDAIGQCESVNALVGNLLHLDRLRSGLPAVQRQWIRPSQLLVGSDSVIQSIAAVRRVNVIWQGFDGGMDDLYGDVELLRRLLLNLVGNAIAISKERSHVFVSLRRSVQRGMARLMVTDQGPGMPPEQILRMARRGESGTGGTGLGLAIGRALAALHFGRLIVSSRLGEGTKIGIEIPAGGPPSVADAFGRWRETMAPARGSFVRTNESPKTVEVKPTLGIRVDDSQSLAHGTYKDEVLLPFDGSGPRNPGVVMVAGLRLETEVASTAANHIDKILQLNQRMHELVYRTDTRRWVLLWDGSLEEAERRIVGLDGAIRQSARVEQLMWSSPVVHSAANRSDRSTFRELLIRDALHASARPPMFDDNFSRRFDGEAEQAIGDSDLDSPQAKRLDEEMRRLKSILRRQSERLQVQSTKFDRIASGN